MQDYAFFFASCGAFHGPKGHWLRSLRSYMHMNKIMPPRMTKVSLPVPSRAHGRSRTRTRTRYCQEANFASAIVRSGRLRLSYIAINGPMYFWYFKMNGFGLSGPHLGFLSSPPAASTSATS